MTLMLSMLFMANGVIITKLLRGIYFVSLSNTDPNLKAIALREMKRIGVLFDDIVGAKKSFIHMFMFLLYPRKNVCAYTDRENTLYCSTLKHLWCLLIRIIALSKNEVAPNF